MSVFSTKVKIRTVSEFLSESTKATNNWSEILKRKEKKRTSKSTQSPVFFKITNLPDKKN